VKVSREQWEQDCEARGWYEIDWLAGIIARRGRKRGIARPFATCRNCSEPIVLRALGRIKSVSWDSYESRKHPGFCEPCGDKP
jgi:uncharacterized protein with PIN domain